MTTETTMPPATTAEAKDGGGVVLQRLVGRHSTATLYHDSAENLVRKLEGVDMVITDPPYGVEFRNKDWDKEVPQIAIALPYLFDRVAIIMGTTAAWQFPQPKWVACWARPASSSRSKVGGFSHWSPILLYGDCKLSVDFKSWPAIANAYKEGSWGADHPSPKPEVLMSWLVSELTEEGQTVLDCFMGSGTTGVAGAKLKRNFIGIERDAAHYKTACARIAHELDGALL